MVWNPLLLLKRKGTEVTCPLLLGLNSEPRCPPCLSSDQSYSVLVKNLGQDPEVLLIHDRGSYPAVSCSLYFQNSDGHLLEGVESDLHKHCPVGPSFFLSDVNI